MLVRIIALVLAVAAGGVGAWRRRQGGGGPPVRPSSFANCALLSAAEDLRLEWTLDAAAGHIDIGLSARRGLRWGC